MLFQALIWIISQLKRQYLDHCLYVSDANSGQLNSSELWSLWKFVESSLKKRPSNSNKTTMQLFHCLCTWLVVKMCYKWLSIWWNYENFLRPSWFLLIIVIWSCLQGQCHLQLSSSQILHFKSSWTQLIS